MENSYPKARQTDIIVRPLDQETLIYDTKREVGLSLNPTASAVWNECDGLTPVPDLARRVTKNLGTPLGEETVWLTLRELEKAELLEQPLPPTAPRITRRAVLATGVTIALLPFIASIVAPTVAHAQSGDTGLTGPTGDTGATGATGATG